MTLHVLARILIQRWAKWEDRRKQDQSKILFVIFILAFVVRCSYAGLGLWWAGHSPVYLAIAKSIAFHHSFSLATDIPTASRPPLYPFLIAAFWWTDSVPITPVVLVQIICGAATVVLVSLIAKDRFSEKLHGLLWRKVL